MARIASATRSATVATRATPSTRVATIGRTPENFLTGLAAWFSLDETGTGNRFDRVNNLKLTNSGAATNVAGKISNATQFLSGSTQFLYTAQEPTCLNFGQATTGAINTGYGLTISAWVNLLALPTGNGQLVTFVSRQSGVANCRGFRLEYNGANSGGFQFAVSQDGTTDTVLQENAQGISQFTWYHVVGVWNGTAGTMDLYTNGELVNTRAAANLWVPANANTALSLGARAVLLGGTGQASLLEGYLDMVGIWTRVLTLQEIQWLYNSGSARDFPFLGT